MARPREFEMDDVLEGAMNVFWSRGYADSSLQSLLSAMGIARGSVYKAFQDKHSLYLAALDYYDRTEMEKAVALLCDEAVADGIDRIRALFQAVIDVVAESGDRRGCFLCNAAIDLAQADVDVRARVMAMLKRMEDALLRALSDAPQLDGADDTAMREKARFLINAYMGLRVLARAGYSVEDLGAILDNQMRVLEMQVNFSAESD